MTADDMAAIMPCGGRHVRVLGMGERERRCLPWIPDCGDTSRRERCG